MQNTMLDSTVSSNSQELHNASSAIKLFENPLFKVRVIMRCSDPWFVAKDVAACIEHSNATKMCDLCRDNDKVVVDVEELKTNDLLVLGNRGFTCISESGLYRILAKCNLPKCEPFESWVFDEVLPSIRKTGSYSVTQAQLANLYRASVPSICIHIGNILDDEELQADSVIKESLITASDGKSYRTKLYNLDMLLSLGYRIRSKVAIKFRQWATKHLKELMTTISNKASSHRGRLLLTPCNAKRAEQSCAQP